MKNKNILKIKKLKCNKKKERKKEKREQPNRKANPPMITSAKSILKKNKTKKQRDRTLGQMVKAKLNRQNHTKKFTHTHSQKEKKENIYIYFF